MGYRIPGPQAPGRIAGTTCARSNSSTPLSIFAEVDGRPVRGQLLTRTTYFLTGSRERPIVVDVIKRIGRIKHCVLGLILCVLTTATGCTQPTGVTYYVGPDRVTHDEAGVYCKETGGELAQVEGVESIQGMYEACRDAQVEGAPPATCSTGTVIATEDGDRVLVMGRNGTLLPVDGSTFTSLPLCEVSR